MGHAGKCAWAIGVGLATGLFSAAAAAQPSDSFTATQTPSRDDGAEPSDPEPRRWYGWQTLIADGAATTLFVAGMDSEAVFVALGAYVVAPPIIHLAHRRPLIALGSAGMRLGLPLGGMYIASAGCDEQTDSDECIDELAAGLGIGMVVAMAIDAAAFSWEKPTPAAVSIAPQLLPGGASLTARGEF